MEKFDFEEVKLTKEEEKLIKELGNPQLDRVD